MRAKSKSKFSSQKGKTKKIDQDAKYYSFKDSEADTKELTEKSLKNKDLDDKNENQFFETFGQNQNISDENLIVNEKEEQNYNAIQDNVLKDNNLEFENSIKFFIFFSNIF